MRIFYILFLILLLTIDVFAQNRQAIDSLNQAVTKAKANTTKIRLLNNLALEYYQFSEDTSILYLKQALDLARDLHDPIYKTIILSKLGKHYAFKSKFIEAMEYLDLADNILMAFPNDSIQADIHYYKSIVYVNSNQYEKADEQAEKSLKIAQKINDLKRVSVIYFIYNEIYKGIGEPEKALEYAIKFHQSEIRLKDTVRIAVAMHNLSRQYLAIGQNDSAKFYLQKSIAINTKNENKKYLAINYQNMGALFHNQHQYDSAEFYYHLAIEKYQQTGYYLALSDIKRGLANISLDRKDTLKAIKQYRALIDSSDITVSMETRAKSYRKLAYIAFAQRRDKEAFIYLEKYKELDDGLKEESSASFAKVLEMQMEYDNQKNSMEISRQRVEIDSQRKNIFIIILGSISVVLILVTGFITRLMHTKAQNMTLKQQKLEEELYFKNREMTSNLMALMKKNEILRDISKELLELEKKAIKAETKSTIIKIAHRIRKSRDVELWKEFDIRFNQVHHDFYVSLDLKFPSISPAEKRLCAFLKMNMSTKDISELTGTASNSINTSRYRIRKKMNLSESDNLVDFLSKL